MNPSSSGWKISRDDEVDSNVSSHVNWGKSPERYDNIPEAPSNGILPGQSIGVLTSPALIIPSNSNSV